MITMTKEEFILQLIDAVPEGTVFDNPGGGTSKIVNVGKDKLSYIRGKSRISLSFDAIFDALRLFSGMATTTNDLKRHNPEVFDSKLSGHNCNCTTMFRVLERMGLVDGSVQGSGRRGFPFFAVIR